MVQDQPVDHPEPGKTEIGHSCCRVALLADQTHSDVGLLDHAHVVAAVADCQDYGFHVLFYEFDDQGFFFG